MTSPRDTETSHLESLVLPTPFHPTCYCREQAQHRHLASTNGPGTAWSWERMDTQPLKGDLMSAVTSSGTLTVGMVSDLVGVSVRTLHHWDQIGLVPPTSRTSAGYRSYTAEDVSRIHRVLVYRELGFSLSAITELLDDPDLDEVQHLREQQRLLRTQIAELQRTAEAVDQVLARREAGVTLTAQEQAEIFGRGWRQDWADEAQER